MKQNTISDLTLFNEKAAKLLNSSFADAMIRNESGFLMELKIGVAPEHILIGAEDESVDAVFLTLRMFMQNNDRISIKNISKLYSTEPQLKQFENEFNSLRDKLNEHLDSKNGIYFIDKNYTNREIVELLLYGSKAHSKRSKEETLRQLLADPIVSSLFLNKANTVAAFLIKSILDFSEINKKALFANYSS